MKTITIIILGLMLSGCNTTTGRTVIQTANGIKFLTGGSFHGAGLEERTSNCIKDIFDPSNRGSGC